MRLQNETTWNVIPSHVHETKMQYGRVARDGVACVSYIRAAVVSRVYGRSVDDQNWRALFTHSGY